MEKRRDCEIKGCTNQVESYKYGKQVRLRKRCQTCRKKDKSHTYWVNKNSQTYRQEMVFTENDRPICMVLDCHRLARKKPRLAGYHVDCEFHARGLNDPEKYKKRLVKKRSESRRWRYGISEEQFRLMWLDQNGLCAICCDELIDSNNQTHLDHCAISGKVREILCRNCNLGIGHLKHDPIILTKAAFYLEKHK